MSREKVLGYEVDLLTFNDAIDKVIDCFNKSTGAQIVTINPEMIELANVDKEFSEVLKTAEIIIPDGSGIKLALKLKGIKQEQIPGIDFSKAIIAKCSELNVPIAMVGAKEEIIQKAKENLKNEFSNLDIKYSRNGYFNNEEETAIINELVNSGAKFVLVALGAPKQEFFIKKCIKEMPNTVFVGVGGSFDVWSGQVERAPKVFRTFGCEWLYRTMKQPERIKRIYKTLPLFLIKIIIEAMCRK